MLIRIMAPALGRFSLAVMPELILTMSMYRCKWGRGYLSRPRQLVGYPIIDLRIRDKDLHWYLQNLEKTIIIALHNVGLQAQRRRGLTGVWVDGAKIASIGLLVRRWVTFHGFALNVTCNPSIGLCPAACVGLR